MFRTSSTSAVTWRPLVPNWPLPSIAATPCSSVSTPPPLETSSRWPSSGLRSEPIASTTTSTTSPYAFPWPGGSISTIYTACRFPTYPGTPCRSAHLVASTTAADSVPSTAPIRNASSPSPLTPKAASAQKCSETCRPNWPSSSCRAATRFATPAKRRPRTSHAPS
ncbi:hypothetical protein ES703_95496 [subsurface metagenome]